MNENRQGRRYDDVAIANRIRIFQAAINRAGFAFAGRADKGDRSRQTQRPQTQRPVSCCLAANLPHPAPPGPSAKPGTGGSREQRRDRVKKSDDKLIELVLLHG